MTKDQALKHALEKFEYMNHVDSIFHGEFDFQINAIKKALAQSTWIGLTDEERQNIALEVPMDAVLITEAKLKEKNT